VKGPPKTDADMALNFVREDDLTEDELRGLVGAQGSVIIAEKYQEAVHGDEMLPKAAAEAVQARIPFSFGSCGSSPPAVEMQRRLTRHAWLL
jgi:hypothetical protein